MANVYDDIINGTFGALNPSVAEMYAGIYPPATATSAPIRPSWAQPAMGRGIPSIGSPNLTAAEQQLLNQQIQQSQALQAGYNPNGTPKPAPIRPSWAQPTTPSAVPTVSALDQSAYDARNKPGTWMAQSRMQAQALARQMGALRGGGSPNVPGTPQSLPTKAKGGGLASLITGKGTPRASGGLFGLLFGGGNSAPAAPYGGRYSPAQLADRAAQGQAIGDANRRNPNPTYTVSGDNNSFMPRSVQESLRWQSGY